MACSDLKKRIEFALKDLVKKHETFSLDEINTYLDPQNRMDFKEIFEIAHPFLCEMNASWHGSINPIGIIVSVNEPVVGKIHVVQNYFPDFMQSCSKSPNIKSHNYPFFIYPRPGMINKIVY